MKIVTILQGAYLGGTENASLRLMLGMKQRGHSCEVVSLTPIGNFGPVFEEHGIPAIGLPYGGRGGWRSFIRLWRTLRSNSADAVLMTGPNLVAMMALGGLYRNKRVLAVHFHHAGVKPLWQWRLIYSIVCRKFNAVTFPSDFVREEAERIYPPLKKMSYTLRDPIPVPELPTSDDKDRARRALGLPQNVPVIGNAGWLIPRKRFDIFLRVAEKVLHKKPNAVFLIAGGGEEQSKLEQLARELKISKQVKWLGWQKDLTHFYHSLDVMLFNSDFDAMGLSPLEAISYGVPLVASIQQGGLKEIVDKEDYGFLIPTHDIDALAEKTMYYLENTQEGRKAALACRDRIVELFDIKRIAEKIELLFQEKQNV